MGEWVCEKMGGRMSEKMGVCTCVIGCEKVSKRVCAWVSESVYPTTPLNPSPCYRLFVRPTNLSGGGARGLLGWQGLLRAAALG